MNRFQKIIANFQINRSKSLWMLFILEIIVFFIIGLETLFGFDFERSILVRLTTLLPFILVILHTFWYLSIYRGLFFILLASSIAFAVEFITNNPNTFGEQFVYHSGLIILFGVSLGAVVYWIVFIYLGYTIVNSFLVWLNQSKPSLIAKNFYLLPILVLADGLVVVAIDLFMDPIYVKAGFWTWLIHGDYFGVPLGNFVGWFIVVILTTSIFRFFEYFRPLPTTNLNKSVFLIPALGYATLAIYFGIFAIILGMYTLALIGLLLMLPTPIVNIILYKRYRKNITLK